MSFKCLHNIIQSVIPGTNKPIVYDCIANVLQCKKGMEFKLILEKLLSPRY